MKIYALFILLCAMTLASCVAEPPSPSVAASLGKPVILKLDQTAKFEDGLEVTFVDVPSDGRCSSCTASFAAVIALRMTVPGKSPVLVNLSTPPLNEMRGDPSPYAIKFVNLTPQRKYPPDALNRAEYVVTVTINK